ncbi:MAG: rRNA pseudouridine synthase [Bacteroidales bacterium]|jgi:23S rRNA pseudouridine2605 synthase|nr:rRNA pseudouridine synthase [Bacteroidales bacterium]
MTPVRKNNSEKTDRSRKPSSRSGGKKPFEQRERKEFKKPYSATGKRRPAAKGSANPKKSEESGLIRLNRYIARSGICSRREADELITTGEVKVNGVIVTELGTKVSNVDKIHVADQLIRFEKPTYLLLNKPKGYITTTDDPYKRRTVMALIENACKESVYPVGRLDRNTTGLLLFTNDGDMAKKLTHPSSNIRKIYHVHLDKALTKGDMIKIAEGLNLEDGIVKVDEISYAGTGNDKKEIGITLHSGKNRIVRRIFESLGYQVVKLDRVLFAGLTKKDLKRGHFRFLTPQEVNFLKML